jgi:catechol 2,3-dioxygenase-like lactoylglutathione lyase family enzyme
MTALTLSLLAKDLAATRAFYERLGFCLSGGDPSSGWMELMRGAAVLQFYDEAPIGTLRAPALSGTIYVRVDDVDALARSIDGHTPFEWGAETMDYGMREFAIRDPNNYLIAFSAPVST